jgi:hypothetical protein
MHQGGREAPERAFRLVEQTELAHDDPPVVVDALAGQPVVRVEREHATERKVHATAGCRHAAPGPQVRATNRDLEHDRIARDVPVSDLDREVGQRREELGVVGAHAVAANAVVLPRLVIVAGSLTEGRHQAGEIVPVLASDMLLDEGQARLQAIDTGL